MKPARAFLQPSVRSHARARARAGGPLSAAGACGALAIAAVASCVPAGNSTPSEAGPSTQAAAAPTFKPSENVMRAPFFDSFDRAPAPATTPSAIASATASATASIGPAPSGTNSAPSPRASGSASAAPSASTARPSPSASSAPLPGGPELGPDWVQAGTNVWHIENGKLCGQGARNHGVWLTRVLPINARIEFEAVTDSPDGDLKAEFWGDGQSAATSLSYTNATSYLTLFGGWKNKIHALARINEHGKDRKEIAVDTTSDDPRQKPVIVGQAYRFKVERTDGKTVHWYVDDIEFLSFADTQPLVGAGHDHFGFNDWDAKVCFDNVRVTPLP